MKNEQNKNKGHLKKDSFRPNILCPACGSEDFNVFKEDKVSDTLSTMHSRCVKCDGFVIYSLWK